MKPAGNILPTAKSIAVNNEYAQKDRENRRKASKRHGLIQFLEVSANGETRYYDGLSKYAIIGRDMLPKWFEVREDGDYPTKG